ncbi:hypothetical protein A2930_03115 [Candidatus Giovannonibacteria bacterium RIFCSPLOWO2_01_FULL_45_34]|uniref:LamG-like jellyroll fold domain-containing protein n=1 Tax=Candidatus Giovannonibacteria bacterium RIFCSPLOWO2_01_FULL_45_34 TaxID=1798351 RepID=A0A1F5WY20_9BACT|nr:MAG: hypothetical protein A2930_03115 [Candidatus Giovannonibacteria bacterium RIFCSPLOWO2_01_FULL_45_34]
MKYVKILSLPASQLLVFFVLAFSLLNFNPAHAGLILQHPTYTGLNQGLVGYWSFDGKDMAGVKAYDRSGQGNDGTLTNGPASAIGRIGQGLSFDGSNDYVNTNYAPTISSGTSFSLSVWFKTTGTVLGDEIFSSLITGGSPHIILSTVNGACTPATAIIWDVKDDAGTGVFTCASKTFNDGLWHHAVGIIDRATQTSRLYVDNILQDSDSISTFGAFTLTGNPFFIGARDGGGSDSVHFPGSIDDVRVYNRALSADEIKRLYKIGATLKINTSINNDSLQKGLVGYWSFDGKDMANITAYDRSGNTNNGTLTGGPTRAIGKLGQGLSFDGSNDYVRATRSSSLNGAFDGAYSVSMWFKSNSSATIKTFYHISDASSGSHMAFFNYQSVGKVTMYSRNATLADTLESNTSNLNNDVWRMVTFIQTGTNMLIYIDGVLDNSRANGTLVTSSDIDLFIGARSFSDRFFPGLIDDVRIYNRALSADEIKRLYKIGATLKVNTSINNDSLQKGLVGYWSFNDNDLASNTNITTALDRSGQGNDGKLQNMSTSSARAIGKIGQGLSFDGVDDYVQSTNVLSVGDVFTVSMWFKRGSLTPASYHTLWSSGKNGPVITLDLSNSDAVQLHGHSLGTLTTSTITISETTTWHHLVVAKNGSASTKMYIDGIDRTGTVTNQTMLTTTHKPAIGMDLFQDTDNPTASSYFNGPIDDVRIYNRTLTRDEIKRLYSLGR